MHAKFSKVLHKQISISLGDVIQLHPSRYGQLCQTIQQRLLLRGGILRD